MQGCTKFRVNDCKRKKTSVMYRAQFIQFSMVSFILHPKILFSLIDTFSRVRTSNLMINILLALNQWFFYSSWCAAKREINKNKKSIKLHRLAEQTFNVLCIRLRFAAFVRCTIKILRIINTGNDYSYLANCWKIDFLFGAFSTSFSMPKKRKMVIIVYRWKLADFIQVAIKFKLFDNDKWMYLVE